MLFNVELLYSCITKFYSSAAGKTELELVNLINYSKLPKLIFFFYSVVAKSIILLNSYTLFDSIFKLD